ncbi:MAG: homoserine dehydrogenase [Clostridiales bacterium]|nr:homoserine dehydrogenase [Clostridiales bacterium]
MVSRELSICMIGFGNAGKEFCKMLLEKTEEIQNTYNFNVVVTAISTKTKGALFDSSGIDLNRALYEVETEGRFSQDNPQRIEGSALEIIKKSGADVLIELSTLSIKDGQPAISHIEEAIRNNMHVITANKGPIAWDYKRLKSLADEKGIFLLHETTVMDGAPIFNLVEKTLPGCVVLGFKGILNSTTNFIMEEMEAGSDYETALKEAQRRGFAEADPSMDIDGWDAAAKTAALINVLMDGEVNPMTIDTTGISGITIKDIEDAKKKGGKIKLLCEGYRENGTVKGRVYPSFVDNKDIFSNVDSTTSILSITTDLMGEICIVERNPEIRQTAYGVYSDLLTLIKELLK